jgi:hypothetical protein
VLSRDEYEDRITMNNLFILISNVIESHNVVAALEIADVLNALKNRL